MTRRCEWCGQSFVTFRSRVIKGKAKFCSQRCGGSERSARRKTAPKVVIRRLRDGDPVPPGEPKRYIGSNGYVRLRWRLSRYELVEAYEHRVVAGVLDGRQVHHINGDRADNRPENLRPVSALEHGREHAGWDIDEARRLYEGGMSLLQIGKLIQRRPETILRSFRRRGIPTRNSREAWVYRKARSLEQ